MKIHRPIVTALLQALRETFEEGRYADKVIEWHLRGNKKWGARDRRFFAEATYDIVRWWRRLWAVLGDEPEMSDEKLWPLFSLWYWQKYEMVPELKGFPKLVDGPKNWSLQLRKIEKNRAIYQAIPDWLDQLGAKELGEDWEPFLEAVNLQAPVVLRANDLKKNVNQLASELAKEEIETEMIDGFPSALRLKKRKNVFRSESFKKGFFEMQDAVSQRVAPMLNVEPGQRVVDACAGAGGKTLHIAALMQNKGRVIALDISARKLDELKKRARRAGVDIVETRVIENTKVIKRLAGQADRLLLDVPCSGLGVLRRNPDTKWKLKNEKIEELKQIQKEILANYSKILRPGGTMVYATCSVLPSENEEQVRFFLSENDGWELVEEKRFWPQVEGYDGFYAAVLRKNDD